jgi:hypothetical protein
MKIRDLLEWENMPGPGDEATWGPPTGHPNDPRTPEYHPETFEDDVVVQSVYYDANTKEIPIEIKVSVEAEASEGYRGMQWDIGSFQPTAVKIGDKTVPWDAFVKAIPQTDNEMYFDTKHYQGEWHEMLTDVMDKPSDPHDGDDYYEDRDR